MPDVPTDSITSARFSLRVDGEPHFLLVFDAEGNVKRMGYSTLGTYDESVVTGRVEGLFEEVMRAVPPGLFGHAGVYTDPGTEGSRCQWRVDFDSDISPIRFDIGYHSGSAGLPPSIGRLIQAAEGLTEDWYREQLVPAENASPDLDAQRPPAPGPKPVTQNVSGTEVGTVSGIAEYLSFDGRIGRVDYVLHYGLPLTALGFAGSVADSLVGLGGFDQMGPMGVVAGLLTIWPAMAGWAKRLHDFETSLWVVPGAFVGMVLSIAVGMVIHPGLAVVAGLVWALALMVLTFATYLWPGTKGPNKFGSDPSLAAPVS